MKVSEAIDILKDADPEAIVIVSSDHEGNSYREAGISIGEIACQQDGELITCDEQDIAAGEYEGWEDYMFPVVVMW